MIRQLKQMLSSIVRGYPAYWTFAALLSLATAPVQAAAGQSHESIRQAVRTFLTQQTADLPRRHEIEVDHLDPRLRVKHCSRVMEPFLPPGSNLYNTTTVGVRCRGVSPWTLYVPAKVKVLERVIVTTRPLPPGHRVTADDITAADRDLTTLSTGYTNDPRDVIGKLIRRPILANRVVTPDMLARSRLINRGDQVLIVARMRGLEVRMLGRALTDGAKGDDIKVENLSSRQIVVGTVAAPGTVKVHL